MLRERKIVLFVMGDEEILERSRMVVSQLALARTPLHQPDALQ